MPIFMYPKCWRGRNDCEPIHCIDGVDADVSEESLMSMDYEPNSFVCSGIIASDNRNIEQDCYRLCFKNDETDEMSDNDIQDLSHIAHVVTAALALHATREVNGGMISVPTEQGDHENH